jgi:hypothetical protein
MAVGELPGNQVAAGWVSEGPKVHRRGGLDHLSGRPLLQQLREFLLELDPELQRPVNVVRSFPLTIDSIYIGSIVSNFVPGPEDAFTSGMAVISV